jgi:hypothetical protein
MSKNKDLDIIDQQTVVIDKAAFGAEPRAVWAEWIQAQSLLSWG